jgi:hypothetical protein
VSSRVSLHQKHSVFFVQYSVTNGNVISLRQIIGMFASNAKPDLRGVWVVASVNVKSSGM